MIAANAYGMPRSGWMGTAPMPGTDGTERVTCAVWLIDRRTGAPHRIGGLPLTLFTRAPAEAVAALMAGRDPALWTARVTPLAPEDRR